MNTECNPKQLYFQGLGARKVVASFDGGTISSDAGALVLREVDAANGFIKDFSGCFTDYRNQDYVEHAVKELVSQRTIALCLGYEDINDHDLLRHDPLFAAICGKLDPLGENRRHKEDRGKALAGKSTLNRLETFGVGTPDNYGYKKIRYHGKDMDRFFVDAFLKTHPKAPKEIILDLDATDDPLHGHQQGRFFHGFYDCYCYLPLYIFCDDCLLAAKLKTSNLDPGNEALEDVKRVVEQIRESWPSVKIIIRGDSGFCREDLMEWCEENEVFYLFGIAKNSRLVRRIAKELREAERSYRKSNLPERLFKDFTYRTLKSWSKRRRVIGKAEYLAKGANPRFVVTNISAESTEARPLYEEIYCARGDMENRIKEQQLYLFADRTSSATMRANQLRLYFSSLAYVIMTELSKSALQGTELARAQCHTIRLKLLKIGAQVKVSFRRIHVSISTGYPYQDMFLQTMRNLKKAYPQLC